MRLILPLASVCCMVVAACSNEAPNSKESLSNEQSEESADKREEEPADDVYSEAQFLDDLSNRVDFETIYGKIHRSSNAHVGGFPSIGFLSFIENPTHRYLMLVSLEGKEVKFVLYGETEWGNQDYFDIIWPLDKKGKKIKLQQAFLLTDENDLGEQGVDPKPLPQ